jgi:hypothetical protein
LLVVLVGFGGVLLALLAQAVRFTAVAALVGLLRLRREMLLLSLLFTCEISEAIVLLLSIGRRAMVEGWPLKSISGCVCAGLEDNSPPPPSRVPP